MKTIKYAMTNGLSVDSSFFKTRKMMRVCFAIQDTDTVVATVESANTGGQIKIFGSFNLTKKQFSEIPDNPYDDMVFNRAAFALFNITI